MSLNKHLNIKVLGRGLALAVVMVGIIIAARPFGEQMQKLPTFDKIGLTILIEDGLKD